MYLSIHPFFSPDLLVIAVVFYAHVSSVCRWSVLCLFQQVQERSLHRLALSFLLLVTPKKFYTQPVLESRALSHTLNVQETKYCHH